MYVYSHIHKYMHVYTYLFINLRLWLRLIHHSHRSHIIKLRHSALHSNIRCLALWPRCGGTLLFLLPSLSSLTSAHTSASGSRCAARLGENRVVLQLLLARVVHDVGGPDGLLRGVGEGGATGRDVETDGGRREQVVVDLKIERGNKVNCCKIDKQNI